MELPIDIEPDELWEQRRHLTRTESMTQVFDLNDTMVLYDIALSLAAIADTLEANRRDAIDDWVTEMNEGTK